ncbi:hypothetical protein JOD63_002089 [Microbacterium terrae]|uniref:Uncharacterized protein n=1 Tax=Microbacterium terrae TaxID=69369 RepID=A0A0M2GZH5_9MICO|nr:hypothetical protein [Microbacterium terrae]KJL39529.1 hypothetical protein RS81_01946 [Microbacterium terrae]MBP1078121.1 hypothetical protein [Microbacterium terrae]GLJ97600.1 hypothetical protein GCM10017594_07970 [Microbacterium terrae]
MGPRLSTSPVHRIASVAYAVVTVAPAAALVVYLVGSLILSGGQVSETTEAIWGVVIPYPLFVVPTWVLVGAAIVSVVLVVVVVASARADDILGLRGLIGPTVAAIIASLGFALLTPDAGRRMGDAVWGGQWVAAVISAASLLILVVGTQLVRARTSDGSGRAV